MSTTTTTTFTRTNARYLASKIAADLRQLRSFYGKPTEQQIDDLYDELVEMLAGGYVATYEAGFRKDGKRVVSQRYSVSTSGVSTDERAGGIYARADMTGASWFTFMSYSPAWWNLSDAARKGIKDSVPIDRTPGEGPTDGNGYWVNGRSYASGGTSTSRSGRVAGGIAAPGSRRSRRDSLPSPGSSHQPISTRGPSANGRTGRDLFRLAQPTTA